jgi:hypothetical protein
MGMGMGMYCQRNLLNIGIIMFDAFIAARNPRTPIMNAPNECTPPGAPKPARFKPKQSTSRAVTTKTQDGSSSAVEDLVNDIDGLGISGIGDHLVDVGSFPLLLINNQKTDILIDRIHILCEKICRKHESL